MINQRHQNRSVTYLRQKISPAQNPRRQLPRAPQRRNARWRRQAVVAVWTAGRHGRGKWVRETSAGMLSHRFYPSIGILSEPSEKNIQNMIIMDWMPLFNLKNTGCVI